MKSTRRQATAGFSLALVSFAGALHFVSATAGDWSSSVGIASDYFVHGLKRSGDDPSAQFHLGFTGERGWSTGVTASTVSLDGAPGPDGELNFYAAAYAQLSRDWRFTGQLGRYEFLNDTRQMSYDYTELAGTVSFRDALSFTLAIAPQYSYYANGIAAEDRRVLTYELGARHPLGRHLELTAGIGYTDLQDLFAASHWYWSSGAELNFRRLKLGVGYQGADSTARYLFGARTAGNTWVASLAYRLF